jgi:hypothetical protein
MTRRHTRPPDRLSRLYQLGATLLLVAIVAAACLAISQGVWQRAQPTATPTLGAPTDATLAPVIITQVLPTETLTPAPLYTAAPTASLTPSAP